MKKSFFDLRKNWKMGDLVYGNEKEFYVFLDL